MEGKIEIKVVSEDIIEILGINYYNETYLKEMMRREYERGLKAGQTIHVLEPMENEG